MGHQGSIAPGRPVLHFFVHSRRPRRESYRVTPSSYAPKMRVLAKHSSGGRRCSIGTSHGLEIALLGKNRPGDPGELVGQRDRQHIVVEAFFCGFDPRLQAVLPLTSTTQGACTNSFLR